MTKPHRWRWAGSTEAEEQAEDERLITLAEAVYRNVKGTTERARLSSAIYDWLDNGGNGKQRDINVWYAACTRLSGRRFPFRDAVTMIKRTEVDGVAYELFQTDEGVCSRAMDVESGENILGQIRIFTNYRQGIAYHKSIVNEAKATKGAIW